MGASVATETTLLRNHQCRLCESPEYDTAKRLLQRSGLNPDAWGFLAHDIAFQLRNGLFYSPGVFIPAKVGRVAKFDI